MTRAMFLALAAWFLSSATFAQPYQRDEGDVVILGAPALSGQTGLLTFSSEPVFSQTAQFRRVIEIDDPIELRYIIGGRYVLPAGTRLYWIERGGQGSACSVVETVAKCYQDTNADGLLDTAFYGGRLVDGVYLFPNVGPRDRPMREPVRFRFVGEPVANFDHQIGVALDRPAANSPSQINARLVVRGMGAWVPIGGTEVTLQLRDGEGTLEMLGSRLEVQSEEDGRFTYRIVQGFPEQAFSASTIETPATYQSYPIFIPR